MAWSFNRIVRIDYEAMTDKWHVLVTLNNGQEPRDVTLEDGSTATVGGEESFFLKFDDVPSKKLIMREAEHLVQVRNELIEGGATPEEIVSADRYKEGV